MMDDASGVRVGAGRVLRDEDRMLGYEDVGLAGTHGCKRRQ